MTKASQSARPAVRWDEKLPLGVDLFICRPHKNLGRDVDMEDVYLDLYIQSCNNNNNNHVDDS